MSYVHKVCSACNHDAGERYHNVRKCPACKAPALRIVSEPADTRQGTRLDSPGVDRLGMLLRDLSRTLRQAADTVSRIGNEVGRITSSAQASPSEPATSGIPEPTVPRTGRPSSDAPT